jgi:transglutaminase-like putative cysteine protease
VYFGYLWPRSLRIERGFYEQGIWLDDGFLEYSKIGGLAWRDEERPTLLAIPRMRPLARRLEVPHRYYGEARRLLRDRIKRDEIRYRGDLDLGGHDEREDV